jgi:hypothetical protein
MFKGLDFTKMWAFNDLPAFPTNLKSLYDNFLYIWTTENIGVVQYNLVFSSVQSNIIWILLSTIFGSISAQKIMIVLPFIVSFLSCYYFLISFRFKFAPSYLGAIFYSINPVTIMAINAGSIWQLITFAVFPLFILCLYKLFSKNKFDLKYAAILGILTAFFFNNYVVFSFALFSLLPFTLFYFLKNSKNINRTKRYLRVLPVFIILFLIYLPSIVVLNDVLMGHRETSVSEDAIYSYSDISIFNLVRLAGNKGSAQAMSFLDYNSLNSYTILGQILSLIAVSSLMFVRKSEGKPYDFLVVSSSISFIAIIGIALIIKSAPPLVDQSVSFSVFRMPEKLQYPLTFSLVILFAYGMEMLIHKLNKNRKILLWPCLIIVFFMIIFSNFPALDGTFGLKKTPWGKTYIVEDKYRQLPKILESIDNNYQNHRFLIVPWEYRVADKIRLELPNYFGTQVSGSVYGANVTLVKDVYESINMNSPDKAHLLSLFNVKYVIVDNTYDPNMTVLSSVREDKHSSTVFNTHQSYWIAGKPSYFRSIFMSDPNFKIVYKDRNFSIFENTLISEIFFNLSTDNDKKHSFRNINIPVSNNLVKNPSFEYSLNGWNVWPYNMIYTSGPAIEGLYSAALYGQKNTWTNIEQLIPVKENTLYQLQFFTRGYNTTDSHVKVFWYNQTQKMTQSNFSAIDYVKDINNLDGQWQKVHQTFLSPKGSKMAAVAFFASRLPSNATSSVSLLDNVSFYEVERRIVGLPDTYLRVKNYEKINPTMYKVQTGLDKPYILAFGESYNPSWDATVYKDGRRQEFIHSNPLYGINSFRINQTGNVDVLIEYKDQGLLSIALAISGLIYIFLIFYLIFNWVRNKEGRWLTYEQKIDKKVSKVIKMSLLYLRFIKTIKHSKVKF